MTNESLFLFWTVSVPSFYTTTRIISNQGAQSLPNGIVGSSVFHFTRISLDNESPLITQLTIDSVTVGINGTRLFCSTDGDTNNALMSSIHGIENIISSKTSTIHIMYNNIMHCHHDYYTFQTTLILQK